MATREERLAQLRVDVSSSEEGNSSDAGESSVSGSEQPTTLREETPFNADDGDALDDLLRLGNETGFYNDYYSSSTDDSTKLSQLEHQRQCSPESEIHNEYQLSFPQSQSQYSLPFMEPRSTMGSESGTESHTEMGLGKNVSQSPCADSPVPTALDIQERRGSYDEGVRQLGESCNVANSCHSSSCSTVGDRNLGLEAGASRRNESIPASHISSGSKDELLRPRTLSPQPAQSYGTTGDLPTSSAGSSDLEYRDSGTLLQSSLADRHLGSGLSEISSFNYRRKLAPLGTQELRSFVFHDLTVTHHIPRVAVQGFSSLHISDRPSDPRTTKKRLRALTGLNEVRYDCCIEGCISYSLPRYADLRECPIGGCKHARFKPDGTPHAQHSYIPITHRLRLMYSDMVRAREMMSYRAKLEEEMATEV
jgi:hypothetical protein